MKFRHAHRLTAKQPGTDRHVFLIRLGLGYWPCLRAPFVQLAFGRHMFDFWYGLPSYVAPEYPVVKGGYR